MALSSWKQQDRRTVFTSPYMEVWEDTVQLPDGSVIDDYSGVNLPDGILILATDEQDNLLVFEEYKYAINDTILTFPAGGLNEGEDPLEAAARELLEETGYESSELELITKLYPYPSKITHGNYIVRAKNAKKVRDVHHEATESIGDVELIPVADIYSEIQRGRFNTSYTIAAVTVAFPRL
jgi:ADP-ribose pyrophosphatase